MNINNNLAQGNKALRNNDFDLALEYYNAALISMPELKELINFNIQFIQDSGNLTKTEPAQKTKGSYSITLPSSYKKLPITVLIITWDVGHNPLGRSYMLAEVVQRIARHSLLVGFQFPKYGDTLWEPVRDGQLPIVTLPGGNLPEFYNSLERIALRIKPDVVIACKPRLPSVVLGLMIKEKWGCPLIIDVDDHELSFFKDQRELTLDQLEAIPKGSVSKDIEPYGEFWTRLTQSLCQSADAIIVSNSSLQQVFGGTIVPHVRNENTFDPAKYNKNEIRNRFGLPIYAKLVLFFGTPRAHKGIETLARAVSQIKDTKFQLLVVGNAPDRTVIAKLDEISCGRVIYLPNQPFGSIPEIMAMADVVCLPQDEGHAISKFQLPAKAIDAVAMGIPLLVSNTPPLQQLVDDQVAELVSINEMPSAFERLAGDERKSQRNQKYIRQKFLKRYSYAAAAAQLRELIYMSLHRQKLNTVISTAKLQEVSRQILGRPVEITPKSREPGIDIVIFWKQNDTGLYGRRHDMVIKYLASRPDVRKVIVFDAPISEFDLIRHQQSGAEVSQSRWIYQWTYKKMLGVMDKEKISYNVFVFPPGKYQNKESSSNKPHMHEGYFPYVSEVFKREGVNSEKSIFWIYPKNYSAPDLVKKFKPLKVVVDVVDDHRAWPRISEYERAKLTENYSEILKIADFAFSNCFSVQKSMQEFFPNILKIENGCDLPEINKITQSIDYFNELRNWPGKKIGYVGNLESKINIKLLEKIAVSFSDCLVVLIGSTHANPEILNLNRFSNVRMPGVIPYQEISAWVSNFDVGLVPHLNNNLTKNMNPLKVFVYLAHGIPVVSTDITNVDGNASGVYFSKNDLHFIDNINEIFLSPKHDLSAMKDYVKNNSWANRFDETINKLLSNL